MSTSIASGFEVQAFTLMVPNLSWTIGKAFFDLLAQPEDESALEKA